MRSKKEVKAFFAMLTFSLLLASGIWAGSDYRTIGTDQLHSLAVDNAYRLEGGRDARFAIIDARTKDEYDRGHVFSAVNVPGRDFDNLTVLLPKDKGAQLVVYGDGPELDICRRWAEKAEAAGYKDIVIYSEGFIAWKNRKMPVAPFASSH